MQPGGFTIGEEDLLGVHNVPTQMRRYNACPVLALRLLLDRL